jgi:hypothetical protein
VGVGLLGVGKETQGGASGSEVVDDAVGEGEAGLLELIFVLVGGGGLLEAVLICCSALVLFVGVLPRV